MCSMLVHQYQEISYRATEEGKHSALNRSTAGPSAISPIKDVVSENHRAMMSTSERYLQFLGPGPNLCPEC